MLLLYGHKHYIIPTSKSSALNRSSLGARTPLLPLLWLLLTPPLPQPSLHHPPVHVHPSLGQLKH